MNDSDKTISYACPLTSLLYVLNYQLVPVLSGLGILTNTYCVIVFARIIYYERPTNHMFKYLLVKAIHDDVQFIIQVFAPLYTCTTCSTFLSYSSQVWYIYFFFYVESVNEFCSAYLEIFATFDCLITIRNKWPFFKRNIYFILVNLILLIYGFSYYIFYIFGFTIAKMSIPVPEYDSTGNITYGVKDVFVYEYTSFAYTKLAEGFRVWHSLSRDVITIFIFIFLDVLILITLRQSVKKKLRILNHTGSGVATNSNQADSSSTKTSKKRPILTARQTDRTTHAQQAERNFTMSIVISNLNFFIGHSPIFIHAIVLYNNPSEFKNCLAHITLFMFYLSYVTPFFIYFTTNRVFRNYAKFKHSRR